MRLDLAFDADITLIMEEPINPYATPKSIQEPSAIEGVYASGKYVVIGEMGVLPEYCFLTGERVTSEKRRIKKLQYLNPAWSLLLFAYIIGWITYFVVSLSCRKKTRVTYSLSYKGRKKLYKRRLIGLFLYLPIMGVAIFLFSTGDEELISYGFVAVVVFVVALIVSLIMGSVMRVRKYKNGQFYISGSCKEFRNQLTQYEAMTGL